MNHLPVSPARYRRPAFLLMAAVALVSARSAGPDVKPPHTPVTVVVTSDNEGHVTACGACPTGRGLGGLARRATALRRLRSDHDVLLLDAGNALFGGESLASGGRVIVRAYELLGYDVVHLTPRDFRLGKAHTLELLAGTQFAAVSANLVHEKDGAPLARPYVVRPVDGLRVAVIGVSEEPAGLDYLPHLGRQLQGVRIRPPAEALAEWLPKANSEADRVVLLYYGSQRGLAALRRVVGDGVAVICAGGVRPEQVPPAGVPPVVAATEHGKHLTKTCLTDGRVAPVELIPLDDAVAADPTFERRLATSAGRDAPAASPTAPPGRPGGW